MKITKEEKLMFEVMKAIYESGMPISFKGSMVMKACLYEAGYYEETRHTVDIDANWNSENDPSAEQLIDSLQKALTKSSIDLHVKLYRMYGENRSAGFEVSDKTTGEILFTIDMDVNRPKQKTKIYEVEGIRFAGSTVAQMLADKITVISTDKVFRRIKDVVDLYYYSKVFGFEREAVLEVIRSNGKNIGDFHAFIYRAEDLLHSYEKFRFEGNVTKPPFFEVYQSVRDYIKELI